MEAERQWHNCRQKSLSAFLCLLSSGRPQIGWLPISWCHPPCSAYCFCLSRVDIGQPSWDDPRLLLWECRWSASSQWTSKAHPVCYCFHTPSTWCHRGSGHRLCGASQSCLICWVKSSFGTEGWAVAHCWGVNDPRVLTKRASCWLAYMIALESVGVGGGGQWKQWLMFKGSYEDSTWKVQLLWVVFQELEIACFLIVFLSKYWRRLLQPVPFIWNWVVHLITTWLHFLFLNNRLHYAPRHW